MSIIDKNDLKKEIRKEVEEFIFDMDYIDTLLEQRQAFNFGNSIIDKMKDLTPSEFLDCFPLKKKSKRSANRMIKYMEYLNFIKSLDPNLPIEEMILYFLFHFENEMVNDFIEYMDMLWQDLNLSKPKNLIEEFWIIKIKNDERESDGKRLINPHLRIIR